MEAIAEQAKILFVDDELAVLKSLRRFCRSRPWSVQLANSAEEALALLATEDFDVVVSDMRMPEMTGDVLLTKIREHSPHTVRLLLTGYADLAAVESAVNNAKIFHYIAKPWDERVLEETITHAIEKHRAWQGELARTRVSEAKTRKLGKLALILDKQVKHQNAEIMQIKTRAEQNLSDALNVLTQILEWKEGRDSGHARFVREYGERIAHRLGMDENDIKELSLAATLHRIGVLCLPYDLHQRPVFSFNADERKLYQRYPVWGEMALACSESLLNVARIVRHHREAVNGKGFPDGIIDRDIPLGAKIIAVVGDFFDACNGRLERTITGVDGAREYIAQWIGKRYDARVSEVFLEEIEDYGKYSASRQTLKSAQLKPNMKLEQDIVSKSGILLLTKGTSLNDHMIKHLQEFEKSYREEFDVPVEYETELER